MTRILLVPMCWEASFQCPQWLRVFQLTLVFLTRRALAAMVQLPQRNFLNSPARRREKMSLGVYSPCTCGPRASPPFALTGRSEQASRCCLSRQGRRVNGLAAQRALFLSSLGRRVPGFARARDLSAGAFLSQGLQRLVTCLTRDRRVRAHLPSHVRQNKGGKTKTELRTESRTVVIILLTLL